MEITQVGNEYDCVTKYNLVSESGENSLIAAAQFWDEPRSLI